MSEPQKPKTPQEWLETLTAQREQVLAQLHQIEGALALARELVAAEKPENDPPPPDTSE